MRQLFQVMVTGAMLMTAVATAHAVPLYTDDFNRANGSLGSNWQSVAEFPGPQPVISSQQACAPAPGGLAKYVPTFDPAFIVTASIDFSATDVSMLKTQIVFANNGLSSTADVDLRNDGAGYFLKVGSCSSSIVGLSASTSYRLQFTLYSGGAAAILYDNDTDTTVASQSCSLSMKTANRVILLLGDEDGTGTTCVDNFEVDGVAGPAPTCTDAEQNGDETGVDCGGSCPICGCSAAPLGSCRTAGSSSFSLGNSDDNTKDKLSWTWSKGQATTISQLADPTSAATNYRLCLYGNGSEIAEAEVAGGTMCGDAGCWSLKPEKSYTYKDKLGAADGITGLKLSAGIAGKAGIKLKGKGDNLPDVSLPITGPLVVQLQNLSTNVCFSATYSDGQITRNDAAKGQLKAKAKLP